jgi:hypothetical protein
MSLSRKHINILRGAATVLILIPPMQAVRYRVDINPLYTPAPSGIEALRNDWMKIGMDIQKPLLEEINVREPAQAI